MKQLILTSEQWKTISRFPNYQVSNQGRIQRIIMSRGARPGLRKLHKCTNGRLQIDLRCNGVRKMMLVHRLVAAAFIGECPPRREVNHKDGNPRNNCVNNLEYVTHRQNKQHAVRLGLFAIPDNSGDRNGRAKLGWNDVRRIRTLKHQYKQYQLAARFNVSRRTIGMIISGEMWREKQA